MWRLVVSELANKSMYKGQRVLFMGTIKAQVKTIYIQGRKVQSAFFNSSTKPIFRSESARYVLYVQMSREMWDFDTDGTGEIMFHKVVNEFLPELFKRWEDIGARHLVSIILFTRLVYERNLANRSVDPQFDAHGYNIHTTTESVPSKDFYRVLVSDMASGQWADILLQLKKEFRTFLRDVSIRKTTSQDRPPLSPNQSSASTPLPSEVIDGRPTSATRGNILEAINLASSQFSGDYIDRDLVRTGLSIIVLTPGTGVFEVDHKMLSMTTDTLIENGIGIDLVCLSRMPLHSVPLFKYRQPKTTDQVKDVPMDRVSTLLNVSETAKNSSQFGNNTPLSEIFASEDRYHQSQRDPDTWHYGIPHWVDVSFWRTPVAALSKQNLGDETSIAGNKLVATGRQNFVPRVCMYELQMMGVVENEVNNISIPYLSQIPVLVHESTLDSGKGNAGSAINEPLDRRTSIPSKHSMTPESSTPDKVLMRANLLQWMDNHDDMLFRHPLSKRATQRTSKPIIGIKPRGKSIEKVEKDAARHTTSLRLRANTNTPIEGHIYSSSPLHDQQKRLDIPTQKSNISRTKSNDRKSQKGFPNLSRQISFGLRGFGGVAPKAIPVIELSSENVQSASLLTRGLRSQPSMLRSKPASITATEMLDALPSPKLDPGLSWQSNSDSSWNPEDQEPARPIAIKTINDGLGLVPKLTHPKLNDLQERSSDVGDSNNTALSPKSALAPWLTVLNPSNPHKFHTNQSGRLGRWQHVFPRPIRASNIKWKSLCSPASVPLTTEDFPPPDHLIAEYQESVYQVSSSKEDDIAEEVGYSGWLMRELIGARLSHGFQIVVGPRVVNQSSSFSDASDAEHGAFCDETISSIDATISMSRGGTIHQLRNVEEDTVEVKQFVRRSMAISDQEVSSILYKPAVRTTLGTDYLSREYLVSSPREAYDWQRLDSFIADHEEQQLDGYPDNLRYWRARFVLIPVENPSHSRRPLLSINEDDAEEIRLEGIRKLTQLWQRHRYIPHSERRFQSSSRKRKDTNPLDIMYQTRTPSAVVAAELDSTLLTGSETNEGKPSQLLPESDLYERGNLNLGSLSLAIQSERGVKLLDRRWHMRLHYCCFIGIEFTTWLLNNFKDVDSREEAVELGNELMKGGLFLHVEQRHNFRDGNFFYQIASEFRIPRPESKNNWFGSRRSDQSVPSTPVTETLRNYTTGLRSRSSSNGDNNADEGSSTPLGKQKLGVTLSKRLTYDVDHRKKSYRNELINLHYDRISSADDCYHLRIDWMGVTPKLIEDSIVNWATAAERFGLRLVELPIAEASRINELHPFRAPYLIRLASRPPKRQPQQYFDATSFTPQAGSRQSYQIAILKKFNFVLDLEAAKDFPSSVEVTYSWGKPDYRYPQYISRDGVLLAQITDEGDFLLLANRLYNNRSAATREFGKLGTVDLHDRSTGNHISPARGAVNLHGTSPRSSPFSSPMVRATPDVGLGFARSDLITPEKIANELGTFCSDSQALERFYEEVLSKGTSPEPSTSPMDGEISTLALPPRFDLWPESSPPNTVATDSGKEVGGTSKSTNAGRRAE